MFLLGEKDKKLVTKRVEGKRTRIVYFGTKQHSPLQLWRNYQTALNALGEVEEHYLCRGNECPDKLPQRLYWTKSRPPTDVESPSMWPYSFGGKRGYVDPIGWYATVTSGEKRYHFALFTAMMTNSYGGLGNYAGIPSAHIEIVEEAGFEPTLKFVKAEEMAGSIAKEGRVALYGIQFDFDSANLRSESLPTLVEIAKALRADAQLKLYVVGHTDNQGSYDYNQGLSERRARAVVSALASEHGIDAARLTGIGVGPVAPVAPNSSEEGQAKNRRVELVAR